MSASAVCQLKITVRAVTARMYDALWNALMVEVEYFLPEVKVFKERRTARPDPQRVLIVSDRCALLRREMSLLRLTLSGVAHRLLPGFLPLVPRPDWCA